MSESRSERPADHARIIERIEELPEQLRAGMRVERSVDGTRCELACEPDRLRDVCRWLFQDLRYAFATLVVEETPSGTWSLVYVFHATVPTEWVHVRIERNASQTEVPSISDLIHAADWHEREVEDLFGLTFAGHPRLGEFVLHEDWPEGTNPMRKAFDAHARLAPRAELLWEPPTVVEAPGAFAMPIGPVFSDFAESAHFLLETVGEDVITAIPRLFYKYRGVEKIAQGQSPENVLLLAERFSGTSAFAHGLAFCQALESIAGVEPPARARELRTIFAELERLRHHVAAIKGICESTALAVGASQAALIEEELLRLTCATVGHRYLFGVLAPGGLTLDLPDEHRDRLADGVQRSVAELSVLGQMLEYTSSFLDRLEEVGLVTRAQAIDYGLVGPIARASGVQQDMRKLAPYAAYEDVELEIPTEQEGDGYARLRVLMREANQSGAVIRQAVSLLSSGQVCTHFESCGGASLGATEAPLGAAFHWVRLDSRGNVERYRVTPPSFTNWHGFHIAAENFAFQDFPIILASLALSNAECDR